MLQRQIAYKILIKELSEGKPVFEGDRFTSIENSGKSILRTNIIGNVVDKYLNEERRYCVLTLDDGSSQIRLKGFSDQFDILKNPEIGDTVCVIGVLKFFNNELYVMPEIIRKADPRWLSIRRLELGISDQKSFSEEAYVSPSPLISSTSRSQSLPNSEYENKVQIQIEDPPLILTEERVGTTNIERVDSPKLKVLSIIQKEKEMGIEILSSIASMTVNDLNPIINELITEGEIYELKPGYLCSVN